MYFRCNCSCYVHRRAHLASWLDCSSLCGRHKFAHGYNSSPGSVVIGAAVLACGASVPEGKSSRSHCQRLEQHDITDEIWRGSRLMSMWKVEDKEKEAEIAEIEDLAFYSIKT